MKQRYLLTIAICTPLLGHEGSHTVPQLDEATLAQYVGDISYYPSSSSDRQDSLQEKLKGYGRKLYTFVNYYQEIPLEQLSLQQRQLLTSAEYLLALMEIGKIGGFYFPDNGVRRLEAIAHQISLQPEILPLFLRSTFVQKSIGFLSSAIKTHPSSFDNLFGAQFTVALLQSMYHTTSADAKAANILKQIIAQNPPDRAFLNKARALLAHVYARTPDQNRAAIKNLIDTIRFDAVSNTSFVFPRDLQCARILEQSLK